jgi:hypothetical protein
MSSNRRENPDGKGRRRVELKVVCGQPPSEEAPTALIDGLAELIAADLLRRISEGDEFLLSEWVGNELDVGPKSTPERVDRE